MLRILALVLIVSMFAGLALVETTEARPGAKLRGEITAVDLNNSELTLKTRRGDITVVFGAMTRIVVDGQPATPADLAAGQKAIVVGRPDPRNMVFRARGIAARN